MTRTPSKADLEEKEAERERKIKERKVAKELEAAKKKAEKERHAEEIRQKKIALEAEKKSKGKEKVFFVLFFNFSINLSSRFSHCRQKIKQRRMG